MSNLTEIFDSFSKYKVLIIGDVMIDSYLWGNVERISPEAPVPVVSCHKSENRLGGAANVALNIQALGASPILCSVIGSDAKSQTFFDLMYQNNLTSRGILVNEQRITTSKTRVISAAQHLLRVDEENDQELHSELEHDFVAHIQTLIETDSVGAIIFEDYDKGVITPYVIEKVVEIANRNHIPTLVDPKKRNFLSYKGVTLFKPNFKELTEGLKLELKKGDIEGIYKAALELHKSMNIKYLLITLSELGVFISDGDTYKTIPAVIRPIADVSGAGDTVISTAALCLVAGLSAFETAKISNLAGGIVCEKVGVVPIDKQQLIKEL